MENRSWLWKKKSTDMQAVERAHHSASSRPAPDFGGNQVDKSKHDINSRKPKRVKISIESYMYLTSVVDQVKSYEEQVQSLEDKVKKVNEKLSEAHLEMADKDNLVKQHAKVAEEAISGWEKVESESAMLKTQLASVTLLKLTAEDRVLHLDGDLEECMIQIRNLKEEHNEQLNDLILERTNIFDKTKRELESQISKLNQDLLNAAAKNAALSRSLQERSNILIKINEEKSRVDADIEFYKEKVELSEKEAKSLKYELHISRKELEIRNEEKNMSVQSFEVANKQYLEGVKIIAKLEADCQRLRGLVRKKLPGPAAVAQMKLEVENSGREYNGPRLWRSSPRSPLKFTATHFSQIPEISLDNSLKYQKENELLTARLIGVEEEKRVLKEALENHNSTLQSSRSMYTHTGSKFQNLEACGQANAQVSTGDLSNKDEYDDNVSCAGSWATVSIVGNSCLQKGKITRSPCTRENISHLELMDDFLEMEKLAHESNGSNGELLSLDVSVKKSNTRSDTNDQGIKIAISHIHDFVMMLGKESKNVLKTSYDDGLMGKFDAFASKYSETISSSINIVEFVLDVSHVLNKESSLQFNILGFKTSGMGTCYTSDCIDKIALLENRSILHPSDESYSGKCSKITDSTSESDTTRDENLVPTYKSKGDSGKYSLEEFEKLKVDKIKLGTNLVRCTEDLESAKSQLLETEKLLADVKSELTLAQKSNILAETQLKCMAESYRALETRAEKFQNEVNFLNGKLDNLDNELQEEKRSHQEAITRCNGLLQQLQRVEVCESAVSTSQEKDLASAAEKLAECQETIFILDKQLRALRSKKTPNKVSTRKTEVSPEGERRDTEDHVGSSEIYMTNSFSSHRTSSLDNLLNGPATPSKSISNAGSKLPKSHPMRSGSSSASSTRTRGKYRRGISRLFYSKGNSDRLLA